VKKHAEGHFNLPQLFIRLYVHYPYDDGEPAIIPGQPTQSQASNLPQLHNPKQYQARMLRTSLASPIARFELRVRVTKTYLRGGLLTG
jgi:hypothetical protein